MKARNVDGPGGLRLGVPVAAIAEPCSPGRIQFARSAGHRPSHPGGPEPKSSTGPAVFIAAVGTPSGRRRSSRTQGLDESDGGHRYGWNIDVGACPDLAGQVHHRPSCWAASATVPRAPGDATGGALHQGELAGTRTLADGRERGVRGVDSGFASALAYYDMVRAPRTNAALTQGLRDFFGSHTYRRVDAEGSYHTLWSGDRSEVRTD